MSDPRQLGFFGEETPLSQLPVPVEWPPPETDAYARTGDPETSHEAARSLTPERLRSSQREVLALIVRHGPLDDERLIRLAGLDEIRQSPSGLRTRRRELVDGGYLRDSGGRVRTKSGRQAIVWEVTR